MFLSLWVNETPGTITFSSEKNISSSSLFFGFLNINFDNALEVSDLIIQLSKKINPPIKTSSRAGINVSHYFFSKSFVFSILKSSASSFVCL